MVLEFVYYLQDQCYGYPGYCADGQKHGSVRGKRAAEAAIYPETLCKAIAMGIIRRHKKYDEESEESEKNRGRKTMPNKSVIVNKWTGKATKTKAC